jgi:hypothetical protein
MSSDLPGLKNCPVCQKDLRGHRFVLLASIVDNLKDSSRLKTFLNDIKTRNWSEVLRYSEWRGDSDVVQLYAIKCTASLLGLVLIRSPFELYDDDHIVSTETLTANESSTLLAVTERKNWKPLP